MSKDRPAAAVGLLRLRVSFVPGHRDARFMPLLRALDSATTPLAELLVSVMNDLDIAHQHATLLGCKRALERVATFICLLCDQGRIPVDRPGELPISRADIADYLGIRAETLSRSFAALRQQGVIAMEPAGQLRICDRARLQALAAGA